MDEEWRDIVGWEGYYQVSNLGRVKSLARVVERSDGRQSRLKERILKAACNNTYCTVSFQGEGVKQTQHVGRLVGKAFISEACEVVYHKDHNASNNHVENLEWVKYGVWACGGAIANKTAIVGVHAKNGNGLWFRSVADAERFGNFNRRILFHLLAGKRSTLYKGYVWSYWDGQDRTD